MTSSYLFCKRYNPVYDIFLLRYFNQHGIEIDERTEFADVAPKKGQFRTDVAATARADGLFLDYLRRWGEHQQARPAFQELFEKTLDEKLSFALLSRLESEIPSRKGKLLFSGDEVAGTLADFYRRYVRAPLKQSLAKGMSGREIERIFFTAEDYRELSAKATHGEAREAEIYRVANAFLARLETLTQAEIEIEITENIERHFRSPGHMKLAPNLNRSSKSWSCVHQSEWVEFEAYRRENDKEETMLIDPSRGFLISDYVLAKGWDWVVFPQFQVFKGD